ncbi:MAG: hypothetical protein GWP59_01735 [Chlamydiales bacterium]|nr:hypothetical protein [Chlamydiales bacterium]
MRFSGPIPVYIYPHFWLIAFLLSFTMNQGVFSDSIFLGFISCAIWVFVILSSLLIHEFGHALTAKYFGHQASIEIAGFWGVTKRRGNKISKLKEFFVVLNGPLASFFLYLISDGSLGFFSNEGELLPNILQAYASINLFWTLTNLLPIYPLDGGQLMKVGIEFFTEEKALRIATFLSMVFGSLVCLVALFYNALPFALIFFFLTFEAYQTFRASKGLVQEDNQDFFQKRLQEAMKIYEEKDYSLARENFSTLRKDLKSGKIYLFASYMLARIYKEEKDWVAALEVLRGIELSLAYEGLVLYQEVLFELKYYEKALSIGRKAFRLSPIKEIAILNAYSAAQLQNVTEAVGWLRYLHSFSEIDFKQLLNHKTLDPIRDKPAFLRFLNDTFKGKN